MKPILTFICLLYFSFCSFSQIQNDIKPQKYILKISPAIKFGFATSKKAKMDNFYPSNFLYGIDLNFLTNYRIVKLIKKNPNIGIFTAFGTQLSYTKTEGQNLDYFGKNTSKSFEQDFVITPGIQYTKNKFFIDFSIPTSIGYSHLSQRYIISENQTLKPIIRNYNLFNWSIGFKVGVGVKF